MVQAMGLLGCGVWTYCGLNCGDEGPEALVKVSPRVADADFGVRMGS